MKSDQIKDADFSEHAQKLGVLATQLGYEGNLTVGALEDEIRFYQRRSVEDVLELGKRLLLLKEMTPHGQFGDRIQLLGFSSRLAQKFMQAARKFCKSEKNSHLNKLSSLDQGRFLELVVLDDDEIKELSDGGSVLDITLDDIDCMTASELRKKLRDAKADNDAKDKLIQSKDQKINQLDTQLNKSTALVSIEKRQLDEQQQITASALETLQSACLTMHNATVRFVNDINSILNAIGEHDLYSISEQVDADVVAAFQQIAQSSVELGIQIDFVEMVTPSWMTQIETDTQHFESTSELES